MPVAHACVPSKRNFPRRDKIEAPFSTAPRVRQQGNPQAFVFAKCVMALYLSSWRIHTIWEFHDSCLCKTTVSEGLIRSCNRSVCDHKHHWQDTQGLIFSTGMGTQACLMLIKMLLSCPAGSRNDWMPHEKTGSHVISRSCFSYPII